MRCPSCHKLVQDDWVLCPYCQVSLSVRERDLAAVSRNESRRESASDTATALRVLDTCYANSWAVIIGIDHYLDEMTASLECAVSDAEAVADVLLELGFEPPHIITLRDREATRQNIEDLLSVDLPAQTGENDRLLFFFAGHGQDVVHPSGRREGYITPYDCHHSFIASRGIAMSQIERWSSMIPAKHILYIMDCCYSGLAATRSSGAKGSYPDFLAEVLRQPVRQVLTAGRAEQRSLEENGQGVFTRCLLQGLRGDADREGRGFITGSDLGQFVEYNVFENSGQRQRPLFRFLSGEGEFVFRSMSPAEATQRKPTASLVSVTPYLRAARPKEDPHRIQRLCIEWTNRVPQRRTLVLVGQHFSLGRQSFAKTENVDISLRVLPCRSKKLDPENWQKNRLISGRHFAIRFHDDRFEIKADPTATNGLWLRPLQDQTTSSVSETIGEVASVYTPEAVGRESSFRIGDAVWAAMPEACGIEIGHSDVLPLASAVCHDPDGKPSFLRIERTQNAKGIEYLLVPHRLYLCLLPNGDIGFSKPESGTHLLHIEFAGDNAWLSVMEPEPAVEINGERILVGSRAYLPRPCRLKIGTNFAYFREATIQDFTEK